MVIIDTHLFLWYTDTNAHPKKGKEIFMKSNVITYRNRLETRLLLIVCAVIFIPLFLFVLINDIAKQSEHLVHNLLCMLLLAAIVSIPVLIIARYRIVFDFQNRTITYVHYFKPKKVFSFDDVKVRHTELNLAFPAYDFTFYVDDKKIFKISDIDFVGQTKQSDECLKELFTGTEKAMFDWERKYREKGVIPYVSYANEKSNRVLMLPEESITFHIIYLEEEDLFAIQVCELVQEEHVTPGTKEKEEHFLPKRVIEEHLVSLQKLDTVCDKLIEKFREQE